MNTLPESGPETAAHAALAGKARTLLEASSESLDGRTRSRLTQARHAALAAAAAPRGPFAALLGARPWQRWLPAGALAASLLVVALVVVRTPGVPLRAVSGGDEIELLADADGLALAQEADVDYDFYEWAVDDAASQDAPVGG
jgi:hypothetical protein